MEILQFFFTKGTVYGMFLLLKTEKNELEEKTIQGSFTVLCPFVYTVTCHHSAQYSFSKVVSCLFLTCKLWPHWQANEKSD